MKKVISVRTHIGVQLRHKVLTGIQADRDKVEMEMEEQSGIINLKCDGKEFFLSPGNYYGGEYAVEPKTEDADKKPQKKVKDDSKS